MLRYLLFFLCITLVSGCQLRPVLPDDAIYQRGLVSIDAQGARFQACGREQWHSMGEMPDTLRQEYSRLSAGREGLPIYVEGWGRDSFEGWQILDPRVIGGDLDSCLEPFTGTALYAGGLEPAWSLLLSDERLVFNQPGRLRTLVFDQPKRMRVGTLWRWYQRLDDGKGQLDVAFEVERKPCRDEQGVWYALTAHVNLDEVLFDGCARYGDLQRLTLASRYRTPAGQYLRDIHVLMKADGSARLIEENHNGLPLVPRAGAWRFLNSDRILLELARDGSEGAVDTLLWKLGNDGSLTLLNDDPALGRGLELQPLGTPLQWPEGGRKPLP